MRGRRSRLQRCPVAQTEDVVIRRPDRRNLRRPKIRFLHERVARHSCTVRGERWGDEGPLRN